MTVTLELEPELEQGLKAQVQARGVTVEYFLHDLVSHRVRAAVPPVAAKRTLRLPLVTSGIWVLCTGATFTTMSVEPVVVDANILVYGVNSAPPQHAASRVLLEAGLDPAISLYVTSQILSGSIL